MSDSETERGDDPTKRWEGMRPSERAREKLPPREAHEGRFIRPDRVDRQPDILAPLREQDE
jgi:hypothetical protein